MPVPWLRVLDLAIGVTSLVRGRSGRTPSTTGGGDALSSGPGAWSSGHLESRLTGVVVAALREAFDRDRTRLEIEREHIETERRRAERALRLELVRQAGERELSRLRLLAGAALTSWLATLLFATGWVGPWGGRAALGAGWILLFGALGVALAGLARVGRALDRVGDDLDDRAETKDVVSSRAVAWEPGLILAGLVAVAVGVLIG
jgi:hypothetical protein